MPRSGLNFGKGRLQVTGIETIIANLHKTTKKKKKELAAITRRNATETKILAQSVCPVRTGRMRSSITEEISAGGYTFDVFYDPAVFAIEGQPYYAVYVELGTSRMAARPTLRWAYDIQQPIYKQDVANALRKI